MTNGAIWALITVNPLGSFIVDSWSIFILSVAQMFLLKHRNNPTTKIDSKFQFFYSTIL